MSKKYLYFKLFRDLNDTIESEKLSYYEISAYLDDVETIQNVFQLYQNTELKLLINKSRQLQNLLTKSLPKHGLRHGYLWSGEHFPDFTKLLSSSGLIEECIAFQKITDPLPKFKFNPIFQMKRQFEIYNWYVFHLWSFQYYFDKSSKIQTIGESEIEIDWAFESLWEKQKKIDDVEDLPIFETQEMDNNPATFNYIHHNKRAYSKSANMRWIRSLINHINSSKDEILYIPFAGNGDIIIEGFFSGNKMIALEINPIRHSYLLGSSHIYDCHLIHISQAISDIISQIKVLTITHNQVQVDLFVNSTEKQYQKFWQTEKERIKLLKNNNLSDNSIKVISAIRFLIDSKIISKLKSINTFLMNGLINLTAGLLRKKNIHDVIGEYQKELRRLYLDIYIFHKIKELNQTPGKVFNIFLQNALDAKSIENNNIDSVCCFFPSTINKKGFKDDQIIIDILNLYPKSSSLEKHKLGLKKRSKEEIESWNNDIINKGSLVTLLGNYGQNILTRMHNHNRSTEAGLFLKLWIDGYYFLLECSRILKKNGKGCLIFRNPSIKILEEFEEINTIEVFKEMIEKHEKTMHFKTLENFQKPDQQYLFGKMDFYHILLITKI